MNTLLAMEDAQAQLMALVKPDAARTVAVEDAAGLCLAQPLLAARTQPASDLSIMDGYAVAGSGPWRLIGESRGGAPFGRALPAGDAVRIATGAVVPEMADCVVMQELIERKGDRLENTGDVPEPGQYVRKAGADFTQGDLLLEPGVRLGAAQIALVRMAGHGRVTAYPSPTVDVIECGDELRADPTDCAPHELPATNGAMLAIMAREAGGIPKRHGPIPDDLDRLVGAIEQACGRLTVVSGGASVGDHDLVRPALEALGAKLAFWRIAMKPGKPLMVATLGERIVLGLPGNPVSSFVTGFHFMQPAIRALGGDGAPLARTFAAPLAAELPPGGPRREFLRAVWRDGAVQPLPDQASSALHALATADVLIDRACHAGEVKRGTSVPVYPVRNGGYA